MNKTALKTFAMNARRELLKKVEARAMKIGITEDNIKKADIESSDAIFIDGRQLSKEEKIQRDRLIDRIRQIGFKQVMEEVAYTWFNRFTALRFMEVNDYLPTKVRVLSSTNVGSTEPDMMKEALSLHLELDKEFIYELKMNNESEELFKYLIIKHCNDLNRYMPFMFETIDDYTEILFPEGLLSTDSFVRQMTNVDFIPESDWEEIEIIGWMYQYYNTEMNELVYDGNLSKKRVSKELLPAATQLFTPDWAVKYMVENSLGCFWLDGSHDIDIKREWKYFLDKKDNGELSRQTRFTKLNPEDIKVFDPCMGSGHILVYAFEVLMQIYESCGYVQRDAAKLILQKNLYGLDIDYRAYQLASFAIYMKARKYNRRIFSAGIELNLCPIVESNSIADLDLSYIEEKLEKQDYEALNFLINVYLNAREYGSILNVEFRDYDSLLKSLNEITKDGTDDLFQNQILNEVNQIVPKLIKQARIMTQQYEVVITNPPYLNSSRMSPLLNDYVKDFYPDTKTDLSTVMYQKTLDSYSKQTGFISFITTTSWMFLKSFEQFREKVIKTIEFNSLVDFGTELFEGKVGHNQIVSWVNKNTSPRNNMVAINLTEYNYSKRDQKEREYFNEKNRYYLNQKEFSKIPGVPIAYWVSEKQRAVFEKAITLSEIAEPKQGLSTADNNRFLRLWHEVNYNRIGFNFENSFSASKSGLKWFPFNKGGDFRKWYGNNEYVINWENDGKELREFEKSVIRNPAYYFKESITWTLISSSTFGCRYSEEGFIFDAAGSSLFTKKDLFYILGFMSSKLSHLFLKIINPTMNFSNGVISKLPFIDNIDQKEKINEIVLNNIRMSKRDWDSFENSWSFGKHPLTQYSPSSIKSAFEEWSEFTKKQFNDLKRNEEELNRIFIEIYGLQDEITPEVDDKDITIRTASLERDIKSFISYAIGCSFGRYSLDEEGLVYAGGEFNPSQYKTFQVDQDNILPILPGAYFKDDIVSRFIDFVQKVFGEDNLAENLDFVADALGRKKGETAKETVRRYFLNDFYKEHVKTYNKRPIYWLFTSGKEKAFNCLIYMHHYDKTTLSRIRTDYLHDYQIRLDAEKKDLLNIIEGDSTAKEISNAKKELKSLDKKIEELKAYDELLHHMADMQIEIDLDDGVKVNYEKFKGLVAKI